MLGRGGGTRVSVIIRLRGTLLSAAQAAVYAERWSITSKNVPVS